MDGLSVAASAVTVGVAAVQLVDAIDKILKFWKTIEDVPDDFSAIRTDLELLMSIIQWVNRLKWQRTSLLIADALQQCQRKIERLVAIIQHAEVGLSSSNRRKRKWSALKASFKINDIRKIQRSLERSKSDLVLALQITSIFEMEDSSDKIRSLSSSLQNLQVLGDLKPIDHINLQFPVRSDMSSAPHDAQYPPATNLCEGTESSDRRPLGFPEEDEMVIPREASYEEYELLCCTLQCGCSCHKTYRYEASHSFRNLVGDLSVQYSRLRTLYQRCDQQSCRRKSAFTLRATYYFPQWLLTCYIGLIATSRSLHGLQMTMKTAWVRNCRDEIFTVAYDGNVAKVKEYFRMGLASPHDVTSSTYTSLLHFAMSGEHVEFARFLIHRGADPHCESKIRMSPAAIGWEKLLSGSSKSPASLRALLDELDDGEYPTERQMSSIHMAVFGLGTESLDDAIDASFLSINKTDADGRTALSWAAFRGDFRSVRKLLLVGASPDIPARDGCIPLHMAARANSFPCLDILMRYGSKINHVDNCGNTALHYSCKYERRGCRIQNHLRCVEGLLQNGSEINAEDIVGKTPLRVCVESSSIECALLLMNCGATIRTCTKDGMTLLLAAVFYSRMEMLKFLVKQGALMEKGVEYNAASVKAVARSDKETREALQTFLDRATYQRLLVNVQGRVL